MDKIASIIVCAGVSTRFNSFVPKPYYKINDKTILEINFELFKNISRINKIVFVIHADHEKLFRNSLPEDAEFCFGGPFRANSVMNAINYLKDYNPDIVMVHDAARVFATDKLVNNLIDEILPGKYDIILPVINLNDSVLQVSDKNIVANYLPREQIKIIQTPQIFHYKKYREITAVKDYSKFTDEGSIFLDADCRVGVIDGEITNQKITYIEDIKWQSTKSDLE